MARLTQEAFDGYMQQIMSKYENPEECAPMIEALQQDFTESNANVDTVPRSEYDDLKKAYIDRFFGAASNTSGQPPEELHMQEKQLTYANLFKMEE